MPAGVGFAFTIPPLFDLLIRTGAGCRARSEVPMFYKRLFSRFDVTEILLLTAGVVITTAILFSF